MRIEIVHQPGKGFGLKLAAESESEQQQLRDLKGLGIETKVCRVQFGESRRRSKKETPELPL